MAIPKYPIKAAVTIKGRMLGMSDTSTIRHERNMRAIINAMRRMANPRLEKRLLTKYSVPFKKTTDVPVSNTSYCSGLKMLSTLGRISESNRAISSVPTSFICTLNRVTWRALSKYVRNTSASCRWP